MLTVACCSAPLWSYSVLTHEEVVDIAWKDYMVPLLQARYPGLTEDQLREAHSYAYGGSLIQDIGYYPFGNKFYSDVLHYVRTGDFVENLLKDATNADELAFALGALAHYTSDTIGHPYVNHLTAEQFPKLAQEYGQEVTYEQGKSSHVRVEFGLDVAGMAKGFYSQKSYHDFIGFNVAVPLLNRAFEETYGIRLQDVLHDEDKAIRTYRWAVCSLIPRATKAAAKHYDKDIEKAHPGYDKKKFVYRVNRTEYEKEWKGTYDHTGFKTKLLEILIAIVPKVGPLKVLKPRIPDADQQTYYMKSVNDTTDHLIASIKALQKGADAPRLKDVNLDTGKPTHASEYDLSDATFVDLLNRVVELGKQDPNRVPMDLRKAMLTYFDKSPKLIMAKDKVLAKKMQDGEVQARLNDLRAMPAPVPSVQTAIVH